MSSAWNEAPAEVLRRKPRSSVRQAAEVVARGEAAAFFSAGNTGATLLAAHAAFGLLPGVHRPALATVIPTLRGTAVLLDAGANVACRPQHLVQFAAMGRVYARLLLEKSEPSVGLLSIGEEATKGNELTRDAHRRLQASDLGFIGNIEARDLFTGLADVIVCDGFTGNVALKVSEGSSRWSKRCCARSSSGRSRRGSGTCCRAGRSGGFAVAWTTRRWAVRRCWALRGCASWGTGIPRPRRCATPSCSRTATRASASWSGWPERLPRFRRVARRGAKGRRIVIAFVFPGQGSQQVGWARRSRRSIPSAARRSRRRTTRSASR